MGGLCPIRHLNKNFPVQSSGNFYVIIQRENFSTFRIYGRFDMAIKIRRPVFYKISVVKEFTDRKELCAAFWKRYAKMLDEGSTVITFYGASGIGKSALLKKIEDEIKHRDELTRQECQFVHYDFKNNTDLLEVLKTIKFQLSEYGCSFPLFDTGNFYYSLKVGQDVTPPKATSMLDEIPWIKKMKKQLSRAGNVEEQAMPVIGTMKNVLNAASVESENLAQLFLAGTTQLLGASMPVVRTVTIFMSIADTLLMKYMNSKKVWDEDHAEVRFQLNARRQEKNPVALYEYLPTLFAMDVTDWLTETGNKVVIILDHYELTAKDDSWLCGDNGLILMMPNTLWTIAAENKLRWEGELADELEQHLMTALPPEDSNRFLKTAGVDNENLRAELVELTGGYPNFLALCVDFYSEYKSKNNAEPTIDEFGRKREEVVKKIFERISDDDAARDMTNFLCALNTWTDKLAVAVGKLTFNYFSYTTYERVKKFPFIQSESFRNEDLDLTIYRFDKTIQSLSIANIDKNLIADVKIAVDKHFKEYFAGKKVFDAEEIFYLKFWADFVVRFDDDAENLCCRYKETVSDYVATLTDYAGFDAAEEILKLFMTKLENLGETDSVPYTYFEMDLSRLRDAQGKYDEANALANSVYEKRVRLLGDKNVETVTAMHKLAISLRDLGRYDEALKMRETVLSLRKEIFGDEHPDTLTAMNNLAVSLSDVGRHDEALKMREQVLSAYKNIHGNEHPDTLAAMNNLALSLSNVGRHNDAVNLQETALKLSEKIFGDEHPDTLAAMNNLAVTFINLGRHNDAVALQEKVLTLSEKILGAEHPNTLAVMNNLALSLSNLNRYDDAAILQKKVLTLSEKILGEKHPNTLAAMNNFAWTLTTLGHHEEALTLIERALPLYKETFGDEHPDTKEIIALREKILTG